MNIRRIHSVVVVLWVLLIASSFAWDYSNAIRERESIALRSAKSIFDHIVITRLWNARHGGLYAPVTDTAVPNEYLDVPLRDIEVNEDLTLTMINPAFMTRQISDIAAEKGGVRFHITSLNPIRPQNKPTPREKKLLEAFEKGAKERGVFITDTDKTLYFYMAPLMTKKACLKCHADQGYTEGDIRGGISVTLPFVMKVPLVPLLVGHAAIGLVGLVGIVFGFTRLASAYNIIKSQSAMDSLTGIPNRRSFSENIERECRRSLRYKRPLSVIMCDIDHFKAYNDTYGHTSGDVCLRRIAQTLQASLKRPGDYCARYGGEEFVVLLPDTPCDGAVHIAETIRSNIEECGIPHDRSTPARVVTLSLGVATSTGTDPESPEGLIERADAALYAAKERGRNQVRASGESA